MSETFYYWLMRSNAINAPKPYWVTNGRYTKKGVEKFFEHSSIVRPFDNKKERDLFDAVLTGTLPRER